MKYAFTIICLIITTGAFIAQEKPKMSPNEFNTKRDSLIKMKSDLMAIKEEYKILIDSLYQFSAKLDTLYSIERRELLIKRYGEETGNKLANGMIWKGMTERMLLDSWGEPDSSNTDRYNYGVFTQHTYGSITYFFRDKILIDWEETN